MFLVFFRLVASAGWSVGDEFARRVLKKGNNNGYEDELFSRVKAEPVDVMVVSFGKSIGFWRSTKTGFMQKIPLIAEIVVN